MTKQKTTKPAEKTEPLKSTRFSRYFLLFSAATLLLTTLFWSIKGALLQLGNADQLIDGYLFENFTTFQHAILPNQHSFLMKWPVFMLLRLLNFSSASFVVCTVILSLLTVGGFALVLKKFENRPLYLGTILLALSSVLLLVPAQPGSGGLLPVNMAMITTRNIEYLVYVLCLMGFAGVKDIRSKRFVGAVLALILLLVTDRFFVSIGLGAALLLLVIYALKKRWNMVSYSVRVLTVFIISTVASVLFITFLNKIGVPKILGQNGANPYQFTHSPRDVVLGLLYGVIGIMTNFGANPAYGELAFKAMPSAAVHTLLTPAGIGFAVNGAVLLVVLWAVYLFVHENMWRKSKSVKTNPRKKLVATLLASATATCGAFVLTVHYYAGDARYLTLCLFAGFVCLAAYSSRRRYETKKIYIVAGVLVAAILSGLYGSHAMHATFVKTDKTLADRNQTIARIMQSHGAEVLVGDYWRVLPIHHSYKKQAIMPLESCVTPLSSLTSTVWQQDLNKKSFAYILTLDGPTLKFKDCNLATILSMYGRPSGSVLVDGSVKQPKELVLFYDQGTRMPANTSRLSANATILPTKLAQLPIPLCESGETAVNVVAHQDDDLLFMNPDILTSLKQGQCNRTIYVTAGDAGARLFWLKREQGSQAAYAQMLGVKDPRWSERIVELPGGQYVKFATLRGAPQVTLIYMHLPDGDLGGDGFSANKMSSIKKLFEGSEAQIKTVDGQSTYTSDQVVAAIAALMQAYQPTVVRTQSSVQSEQFKDHSDHQEVGRFATLATAQYQASVGEDVLKIGLRYYVGYPVREQEQNVMGGDLEAKQRAFFSYARFDGGVCGSLKQCAQVPTYDAYLRHQVVSEY